MKASVYQSGDNTIIKLTDDPEAYREAIEAEFFTPDGDGYSKSYPSNSPHIDMVVDNYIKYADEIFDKSRAADSAAWRNALLYFIEKTDGAGVDWFLIGSCALAVRGINVAPANVDILFPSVDDLGKVREIFAKDTIQPFTECADWVAKAYGAAFSGCPISIAFEPQECLDTPEPIDSGPYAAAHLEKIEWMGKTIKVPPVELSLNISKRRGRDERVKVIEEYLAQRK